MTLTHKKFDAEVGKVLQLMIHSLYTNKDIFLRELISNASDACDKLRYEAINDAELQSPDEFKISIFVNSKEGQITIFDNGIGMNKDDMVSNLGTVASSGTQRFMENVMRNGGGVNQIGQFGVGFYSAFIVAKDVRVLSRKAGADKTFEWQSTGAEEYFVGESKEELEATGTKIILTLKDSEVEYLEKYKLKPIISTYSDHIGFPIELKVDDEDAAVINTGSAIWARPKTEISEEQYSEFYHHVSHMPDKPWMRIHTKAEGNIEYTSLLYIPSSKPFDLFHPDRKTRVKLYVKRIFITEDGAQLLPSYLRFIRGVVDSEDLPLNINRETLQCNVMVEKIRRALVKKVMSELKTKIKNDPKEYAEFWKNFGEVMKEGLCEGAFEDKEQLLEVCRFHTTKSQDDMSSLEEYVDRMQEGQNEIFYITGDKIESLARHPQLEGFKKREIEVLLLPDHVDDFWVNVVNVYKNKELKSVNSQNINLDDIKAFDQSEKLAANDHASQALDVEIIDLMKRTLGGAIKEVKASTKLVESPACIAVPDGAMSIRMERYLIEQKQLRAPGPKILEINSNHILIKRIGSDIENKNVSDETRDLIYLIYDQACILEGEFLQDPNMFMRRMNNFLSKAI